jgi:hypothetical protein
MLQTALLIALILLISQTCFAQRDDVTSFPPISAQSKPWTRWWWPGNGVDQKNLTRELEQLRQAGFGGVEITPIYGVNGSESRDIQFLSPKWIAMLRHVAAECKRLDMSVDMATCTGWPFGGPMVSEQFVDAVVARDGEKLISKPSGMKVKRAAPGGAGWVLNPYSTRAIEMYLKSFDHLPPGLVRAQFHDSFEYAGNWTSELPERFKTCHGYDLREHVAELFGEGDPETLARVKSDYREVLAAMHLEYIQIWAKWCRARGEVPRNQAHGAPGNLLDLYAASDIPETEIFGSTPFAIPGFRRAPSDIDPKNEPRPLLSKFASSAAHVSGRPLASCETLTWLREHFRTSLSMCKPEIDQMFLAGINHVIYHGTCYSPDDAAWPGWLFYASCEINPRDTLWHDLPLMNQYVARCQAILQSGAPDNDLLVYWPVYDIWHSAEKMEQRFTVHQAPQWLDPTEFAATSRALTNAGCQHDFISDAQLAECKIQDGAIVTSGGSKYRALMLPPTRHIPVQTLEQTYKLVESGATLLVQGDLPKDVPGLARLDERRAQLEQCRSRLSASRVIVGDSVAELLQKAGILCETFVGDGVGFIRRTHPQGHHYFIASLGTRSIDGWVPMGVSCASAVILDPMTGRRGVAATRKTDGKAQVYLQLNPGQSIIVRTFASQQVQGEPWRYLQKTGDALELKGKWQVRFTEGGPALPAPFTTEKLASWTDLGDDQAHHFAGTARYHIEFDRPPGITGPCLLDLGDVRESARVHLNGKEVGAAWALPFQIQLDALNESANVLEIDVTNLAANRLRDLDQRKVTWRIMKEINYVNILYKPFDASGWKVAPSGLMGPVRLIPRRTLQVE